MKEMSDLEFVRTVLVLQVSFLITVIGLHVWVIERMLRKNWKWAKPLYVLTVITGLLIFCFGAYMGGWAIVEIFKIL